MSWRPLNSGDLPGVRRPQPSKTRRVPDQISMSWPFSKRPGFVASVAPRKFHAFGGFPFS